MVRTSVLIPSEKPAKPQPEIDSSQENSLFLLRSANSTSEPKEEGSQGLASGTGYYAMSSVPFTQKFTFSEGAASPLC